jgi:interleukin-1 receptor-associated kinase 1/coatomer subunit beta'
VKLLHSMSQGHNYGKEFMKEFENLRRLNHPNIIQLLGYCFEIKCVCTEYGGRFVLADKIYRALCFHYMRNGSLQRHLDGKMLFLYIIYWQGCLSLNLFHLVSVSFYR